MLDTVSLFRRYSFSGPSDVGVGMYRLLSAFAHGKQWAMVSLDVVQESPGHAEGQVLAKVAASDRYAVTVARWVQAVLHKATAAFADYRGR